MLNGNVEETDLLTFARIIEEIARADGSTAWCLVQASGCSLVSAFLEPAVASEIFGPRARGILAWGPGRGRAIAVDGGYRLTGQWSFASGCHHATWLGGIATIVESDGTPRRDERGAAEIRTLLFPKDRARFEDVWQVSGLRGTGSDTFAVSELFVPEAFNVRRDDPGERREPGRLYAFHLNNVFALGRDAQLQRTRAEPHRSFTFERNLVYYRQGKLLQGKWDDDKFVMDYNLYWRVGGEAVRFGSWSWEQWRAKGRDQHSLIADPLFRDPDHGDFRLKSGSPALRVGFTPPDWSGVGPRPPARRGEAP